MYAGPSASFQLTSAIRQRWRAVSAAHWSGLGKETKIKEIEKQNICAALNSVCPRCPVKKQTRTVHLKFTCGLLSLNMTNTPGNLGLEVEEEEEWAHWTDPNQLLLIRYMTCSDPDTRGRCSVRLPLQAVRECVWWEGEGGARLRGSFTKLRKKIIKKKSPNISVTGLASQRFWASAAQHENGFSWSSCARPRLLATASPHRGRIVTSVKEKAKILPVFFGFVFFRFWKFAATPSGKRLRSWRLFKICFRFSFVFVIIVKKNTLFYYLIQNIYTNTDYKLFLY